MVNLHNNDSKTNNELTFTNSIFKELQWPEHLLTFLIKYTTEKEINIFKTILL